MKPFRPRDFSLLACVYIFIYYSQELLNCEFNLFNGYRNGQVLYLGWSLVICGFWGIFPSLLDCQLHECKNYWAFFYYPLYTVGSMMITCFSFDSGDLCFFFCFCYQSQKFIHFIDILNKLFVLILLFSFNFIGFYSNPSFFLLLVLGLFCSYFSSFLKKLAYWFKIFPFMM